MTGFRLADGFSDGLGRVLDLRKEQHMLTASNLANADTPGYLAKEIPFDELLGDVMAAAERGAPAPQMEIRSLEAAPGTLDGNSVSPEREAVRMTANSVVYDALSVGMSRRLAMLRFAASDGRG